MSGAVATTIGTAVAGSLASGLVSQLLAPDTKAPAAPTAPSVANGPAAMPTPDNTAQQAALQRKVAVAQQTGMTRASTILTNSDDKQPLGA